MLASPLLITYIYLLCHFYVFIFNRPSSFIAAIIFPLEKIRYTQSDERCSQEEDRCAKRSFDRDREWSLTCYVETLHGMIILCLALLHAVVPSRGDLQPASDNILKEVLVYTETASQYGQKIFL